MSLQPDLATSQGWIDLAGELVGGEVLAANDEFFAPKENLIKAEAPVYREGEYTDRGKWMDGWETRRRRQPGHDWCVVRLGLPGRIEEVTVDTGHFVGNHPEAFSLEGCSADGDPQLGELIHPSTAWEELIPRSALEGDSRNSHLVGSPYRFTHLRLSIYPDGGVARMRAYGRALPDLRSSAPEDRLDLVAAQNGGRIVDCSDMFFSSPHSLLLPEAGRGMQDGWETRRRRGPGNDWVIVELAGRGHVDRLEVDTRHFKGNAPGACSVEVADFPHGPWRPLLSHVSLTPDRNHDFDRLERSDPASYLRLSIYPDGGVGRLRAWGRLTSAAHQALVVAWLDSLPPEQLRRALLRCCGSTRWAGDMETRRPFETLDHLMEEADEVFSTLAEEDLIEAFAAHPQIGEGSAEEWSEQEQAGVRRGREATLERLAEGNRRYRDRFGHIFIVCATGLSAQEMLKRLRQRLENQPADELKVAAEEQRKITRLRLRKLLGQEGD